MASNLIPGSLKISSSDPFKALTADHDTSIPFRHISIVGCIKLNIEIFLFPYFSLASKYPNISPGMAIDNGPKRHELVFKFQKKLDYGTYIYS